MLHGWGTTLDKGGSDLTATNIRKALGLRENIGS